MDVAGVGGGGCWCDYYAIEQGCEKMRFNFKSRTVIASTVTALLLLVGVSNPEIISGAVTTAVCSFVECVA